MTRRTQRLPGLVYQRTSRMINGSRRQRQRGNRRNRNPFVSSSALNSLTGVTRPGWDAVTREPVWRFKQTVLLERFSVTTASIGKSYFTNLAQAPNGNQFAGLFKQWRITSATIKFNTHQNITALDLTAPSGAPFYATAVDPTIGTVPVSFDELRQYTSYSYQPVTASTCVKSTTVVNMDAIISGSTVGATQLTSPWLSTTNPDIPVRGVRAYFEDNTGGSAATGYTIDVQAEIMYEFKTLA